MIQSRSNAKDTRISNTVAFVRKVSAETWSLL